MPTTSHLSGSHIATPDRRLRRLAALGALTTILATATLLTPVASPASASGSTASVSLYLSAPGVEGPSLAGTTIETFAAYDVVQSNNPSVLTPTTALAVGSVSAGSMKAAYQNIGASSTTDNVVPWGAGVGSGMGFVDANGSVTLDLSAPRNYLGMLWLAGDATNTIVLRSGGNEVASFSTGEILELVPKTPGTVTAFGGAEYTKTEYYGSRFYPSSNCGNPCNEPFAFIHLVAPAGVTFDQVSFVQGSSGGFEFDNVAVATYSGTFDSTGLVGVPVDQLTNDAFTVGVNGTLNDTVATNDVILPGSTFSVQTEPTLGSVAMSPDGSFTFEAGDTAGETSFEYRVCRPLPSTTCVAATVTITIEAAPVTTTTTPATTTPTTAPPSTTTPVTNPTDPTVPSRASATTLPVTGAQATPLLVIGTASLVLGGALLAMRRRLADAS